MLNVSHTDLNDPWYSLNFEMELWSSGFCCDYEDCCKWERNYPIVILIRFIFIYLIVLWGDMYCTFYNTLVKIHHLVPLAFSNFLPLALTYGLV